MEEAVASMLCIQHAQLTYFLLLFSAGLVVAVKVLQKHPRLLLLQVDHTKARLQQLSYVAGLWPPWSSELLSSLERGAVGRVLEAGG